MRARRLWVLLLRALFHLFYNPFAFTYDAVSVLVSRGHWREWTRQAIPRISGSRVLEVPSGTGNLLLDLATAGYAPTGLDLSPSMLRIAARKVRRAHAAVPLVRARAEALPFSGCTFDSIVMTFPPEFVYDPRSLAEFHRVLDPGGRLIWVDAGRLESIDHWSRVLNAAFHAVGGDLAFVGGAERLLGRAGFKSTIETVVVGASVVHVATATKGGTR